MYYEIHGGGRPLVLLHGALSATQTSFGALLPALAETHQVIAVEEQAHGRTADIDRPLTIPQMARDTAALLDHLGIERADVFGYGMGAGIALEIASRRSSTRRRRKPANGGGRAPLIPRLGPDSRDAARRPEASSRRRGQRRRPATRVARHHVSSVDEPAVTAPAAA